VVDNIYKIKIMGVTRRKKSGKKFDGSKLNVPGQGIATKKIIPTDKSVQNNDQLQKNQNN
jgi:hypothetical protein